MFAAIKKFFMNKGATILDTLGSHRKKQAADLREKVRELEYGVNEIELALREYEKLPDADVVVVAMTVRQLLQNKKVIASTLKLAEELES